MIPKDLTHILTEASKWNAARITAAILITIAAVFVLHYPQDLAATIVGLACGLLIGHMQGVDAVRYQVLKTYLNGGDFRE